MSTPTYVGTSFTYTNTTTTGAVTNGTSVAVGDLLVALILVNGGNTTQNFPSITDTINSGSWNLPTSLNIFGTYNVGGGYYLQEIWGWIRCDHPGTPTINFSGLTTNQTELAVMQFTNFTTGSPSLVTADVYSNQGSSTAASLTSFNNSAANEVLIQASTAYNVGSFSPLTGNFTNVQNFSNITNGYAIETTSGNAMSWGGTLATSAPWIALTGGFKDADGIVTTQGAITLTGQTAGRVIGDVLIPNTAKVRDMVYDTARKIFLPPRLIHG